MRHNAPAIALNPGTPMTPDKSLNVRSFIRDSYGSYAAIVHVFSVTRSIRRITPRSRICEILANLLKHELNPALGPWGKARYWADLP